MEEDTKIEREERKNSREREEETRRQITKKREAEERKLTQKEELEKIEKKESKEEKEELKRPTLTDDERRVLIVLDLVNRHKSGSGLKITGFQVKDFLEVIFSGKNVDKLYSELKKKGFISEIEGSKEFWIIYESRVELENGKKLVKPVLENIAGVLREYLNKNELLKSVLFLSYLDEGKIKAYLPMIKDKFSKIEQVFVIFFFDREFLNLPLIEKIARRLMQEQRGLTKEKLEELCKDQDFLKALVMLNFDEVKGKLGIEMITSNWYRNYQGNISLLVEESKVGDILSKLLLSGITESENLFGINIDELLLKAENIARIQELLIFDGERFKKKVEGNWSWLIGAKKALEGVITLTPDEIRELVKLNAILLSKNGILVNKELKGIYDEVHNKIREKLRKKVSDIPNVVILPFYDKSQLASEQGKIIITLEGYIEDEDVLQKNVVLKISPKEIGMETTHEKNEEYNAIGEIENLDKVKSNFNTCEWVLEKEHYSVKRAKEIIWERENPPISLEEAINKLKEGYEEIDGRILIDAVLIAVNKPTNYSGVFVNYTFNKNKLWQFVEKVLKLKYGVKREEFTKIKERLEEMIEQKGRADLLTLGLGSRPGSSLYYDKEREIQNILYKNYDVKDNVLSSIKILDQKSKEILWIYMKFFIGYKFNLDFSRFKIFYESIFDKKLENIEEVVNTINKSGISIAEERNGTFSEYPFAYVNTVLSELLDIVEKDIKIRKPNLAEYKEKYQNNVIELIGLDYLLSVDGICKREDLREFLWKISLGAWNKFESYKGVISSKHNEVVTINPLVIDKLRELVKASKKAMIKQQEKLKDMILSPKIIDHKIEFDEELGIYKGFVVTPDKEEIQVIIAPWYLPSYNRYFGNKTLIMITGQEEYGTFIKTIKERSEKLTVFFFENRIFSIYSSFGEYDFVNSLLSLIEKAGYKVKNKEFEFEELEEKTIPTEKKVVSDEISSGKATQIVTETEEGSILDEIFTPFSRETFSSLFANASYGPRCVLLIGDQKQGKKMVEDLAKEELKYWGNYNPRLKQIETIKKDERGVKEAVEIVPDPEVRIISINISQEYLGWIAKIIEKLKEVETQGLKYVIFSLEEVKISAEMIRKIEDETSIPTCILDLPSGKRIPEIKRKILSLFGEGIELPLEAGDNLNTFWNFLQKEMRDIMRRMRKKIDKDKELKDVTSLKDETILHYVLRGLTCKYLRQKGYEVEVEAEEKTEEGKIIVVDLKASKKNETFFIEAETCVPTREEKDAYGSKIIDPYKRLVDKMQKYKGKEGDHLILVVPNIFAFVHREVLDGLRNYIRSKLEMKVSIHVINWASYPARLVRII